MLYAGTDPESYVTEYTLVYEDNLEEKLGGECAVFACFCA